MRRRFPSLAAYMTATGTTQQELAAAVGVSQTQISLYLRGAVMPRPRTALRLSKHTGVPVEALLKARALHVQSED